MEDDEANPSLNRSHRRPIRDRIALLLGVKAVGRHLIDAPFCHPDVLFLGIRVTPPPLGGSGRMAAYRLMVEHALEVPADCHSHDDDDNGVRCG